ncbi:LuxR C-terminal-related transcriptional regulator [Dietzia maris]|uniref:LuxR C-terminal-related transcriptional regulator n=1 Tax=Dietzia maris TaxID=37915 RepID=UPI0037CC800B
MLAHVALGYSNAPEVGARLPLSQETIKAYLRRIRTKFNTRLQMESVAGPGYSASCSSHPERPRARTPGCPVGRALFPQPAAGGV